MENTRLLAELEKKLESIGIDNYDRSTHEYKTWYGRKFKLKIYQPRSRAPTVSWDEREIKLYAYPWKGLKELAKDFLHEKLHADLFPFDFAIMFSLFGYSVYSLFYSIFTSQNVNILDFFVKLSPVFIYNFTIREIIPTIYSRIKIKEYK